MKNEIHDTKKVVQVPSFKFFSAPSFDVNAKISTFPHKLVGRERV